MLVTETWASLITTEQLAGHLDSVKILAGEWLFSAPERDSRQEYIDKHIPGAQYFPILDIADKSENLPAMLPSPEVFAEEVGKLGVTEKDYVVVYDSISIVTAARVYWTFKVFGHDRVSVLNGGLPKWIKEGRPIASGVESVEPVAYAVPQRRDHLVQNYNAILANALVAQQEPANATQVVDLRPKPSYHGTAPPQRPGFPVGHIPGSVCVSFYDLVEDGQLVSDDKVRGLFAESGVDLEKKIITTCGGGIAATLAFLALERLGVQDISVYDGSWAEYASKEGSPIVVG